MAQKKRTPVQRKVDIAYVIQLLRTCATQEDVTRELNKTNRGKYQLSRVQVGHDIKDAIQEIVTRNTNNTLQARVLASERQLSIAYEAHAQYLRSCKLDQIKRVSEETKSENDDGKVKNKKTRTETIERLGDPRYLSVMISALSEHARLLGLYTPAAREEAPFTPNSEITNFSVTVNVSGGGTTPPDPFDRIKKLNDRSGTAEETAATTKTADQFIKFHPPSSAT